MNSTTQKIKQNMQHNTKMNSTTQKLTPNLQHNTKIISTEHNMKINAIFETQHGSLSAALHKIDSTT